MKKRSLMTVCTAIALLVTCMTALFGCSNLFSKGTTDEEEDNAPKEYTIQYTDDSGTHQITVTAGMPYALDVVPQKSGYVFMGLYDAEVGGTQYISSTGASLSPFTDGKNMVLFPHFKAKDFTVILDYQGAPVTGGRQFAVAYGSSLPELPKNLTSEHKDFTGWYTKADRGGVQVADAYGLVPVVSVLNDTNFDLSGEYIYLYAGFESEKFTVTCCFEAGMDTEDVLVEYDTPVSQIVPKTRINGQAPLTWSKTQDGEVFNGKVEGDMVLYAVEYAPVIELDSNGGSEVKPVVARVGATIFLPTPTKDLAKFAYWEDMQGNRYTSATMPSKSLSLQAVWQAKLVFDSNGGSNVDDISVAAGNKITLPTPEKEGYIFAGWYTTGKEQYTATTMPVAGIKLKAGWYKAKIEKIIVMTSEQNKKISFDELFIKIPCSEGPKASLSNEIDLSSYISSKSNTIKMNISYDIGIGQNAAKNATIWDAGIYVYDKNIVSDANYLGKHITENYTATKYQTQIASLIITPQNNYIYLCYYAKLKSREYTGRTEYIMWFSNIWIELQYPDTTHLYL